MLDVVAGHSVADTDQVLEGIKAVATDQGALCVVKTILAIS